MDYKESPDAFLYMSVGTVGEFRYILRHVSHSATPRKCIRTAGGPTTT